jgi:hypothetical protein
MLFIVLGLFGCVNKHELVRPNSSMSNAKLERQATAYIAVPQDGIYGQTTYKGSGETTTQVIQAEFAKHLRHVVTGVEHQTFDSALSMAQYEGLTYLIYPRILHWEDRATEWSGKSDKVSVKISIIEASSGNEIDAVIITGKSKWATLGGDHPQELLPKPVGEYVSSLFH